MCWAVRVGAISITELNYEQLTLSATVTRGTIKLNPVQLTTRRSSTLPNCDASPMRHMHTDGKADWVIILFDLFSRASFTSFKSLHFTVSHTDDVSQS
jgi:hypothetical protein